MKVALSLLIFGLVAVSALQTRNVKPLEFIPGKVYIYDYSAQLLTGIPKIANQFSGLNMKAQIVFQAKGSSEEVAMKLTNIRISQSRDLKNAQSRSNFELQNSNEEEMGQRWISQYVRELSKAITFNHVNGQVVNFVADKSETEWSLNLKKSILSLFHLNLSPKHVMRSTEDNQILKPVSHEDLTYYGVYESGMSGICESVYEIDQIPDFKSQEPIRDLVLNVTKTKNYHNCLTKTTFGMKDNYSARHSYNYKPSFDSVVRGYYPVPSQQRFHFQSQTPVKQYTTTKYNISLAHSVAQIEGIMCEGKVIYTTFGDNIMAYTHQKATLVKVAPVEEATLGPISNPEIHEELSYQLPKINDGFSRNIMDIPYNAFFSRQGVNELTQNLPKLFESLARSVLEGSKTSANNNNKDAMQKVVQVVNALSVLPQKTIQGMYRAIAQAGFEEKSSPKHQVMRKMFLDALALCGSNEAAQFISEIILNQEVTSHEAQEMLATLPRNMNFPTTKTLESYLELMQNQRLNGQPMTQTAVAVSFGKMVNVASKKINKEIERAFGDDSVDQLIDNENKNKQHELKETLPKKEDIERYVVVATRLLEQADSFTKKVSAIECLANMGIKEVLATLEPFVSGSGSIEVVPGYEVEDKNEFVKERNFIRTIAIYSLAHVARGNAKQVLPLVLPVYRNVVESHEIRLAAFTVAMLCKPEQHILESIASDLHRESDKHVINFVVSAFKSIGNLTTPCQKSFAQAASEVVESAPETPKRSSKYSTYMARDFYDTKRSFGIWASSEWIKSRKSPIPQTGYIAVSQISSPFHDEFLEIGFETKGLEKIAKRIMGSNGLISSLLQKNQKDKFTREQVSSATFNGRYLRESSKLNLFVKMFEQTSIYPLDESMINEAIEQVESWSRQAIVDGFTGTFVKVFMPSSISHLVVSEVGLPIVVAHRHPLVVSLKIDNFNVQKRSHSNGSYKGFVATAEIEPKIMYSSYTSVYGVEPVQGTTVGTHVEKTYHASLPLKLRLSHLLEGQKWEFAAKPKVGHEAVYHKSEATTFLSKAKIVFSPARDWLESSQSIRKVNSLPVKVEKTFTNKQVPVAAKVTVEVEQSELDRRALQKQIARHGLIPTFVKIVRNSGLNNREVRLRIEDNGESQQEELGVQWTMALDESVNVDSKFFEESDESDYQGSQDRNDFRRGGREGREGRKDEEDEEESYGENELNHQAYYRNSAQRNSLFEEMFSRLGAVLTGENIHYTRDSEKKLRRQVGKWLFEARKNLQWIKRGEKPLTGEEEAEEEREDEREEERENQHYNYHQNYHKLQGLGVDQNGNQFMRTEYVVRGNTVCFSTQPVMECKGSPVTTKRVSMDFYCLPMASPLTQHFMQNAKTSVLRHLSSRRVDITREITVPDTCSA